MTNSEAYQKVVELLDQTDLKQEKPEKYDHILEFFRIHLDIYGGVEAVERHRRGRAASLIPTYRTALSDSPDQRGSLISPEKLSRPTNPLTPSSRRETMQGRISKFQGAQDGDVKDQFADEALKERSVNAADDLRAGQRRTRKERAKNKDHELYQESNFGSGKSTSRGSPRIDTPHERNTVSTQETPKEKDRRSHRSSRKDRLTKASEAGEEEYYAKSPDERDLSQPKNAANTARQSLKGSDANKSENNKTSIKRRATDSMSKTTQENPKAAFQRLSLQRGGRPQDQNKGLVSRQTGQDNKGRPEYEYLRETPSTQREGAPRQSQTVIYSQLSPVKVPMEEAKITRPDEGRELSIPRERKNEPPKPVEKQYLADHFGEEELQPEQPKPLPFKQQSRQEAQPEITEGAFTWRPVEDVISSRSKAQELQPTRSTVGPSRVIEKQNASPQASKEDTTLAQSRNKSKTTAARVSADKKNKSGTENQQPSGALFKQPRVTAGDKGSAKQSQKGSGPESPKSLEEKKEELKPLAQGVEIREEVLHTATRGKSKTVQPKQSPIRGLIKEPPGSAKGTLPKSRISVPEELSGTLEENALLRKSKDSKLNQSKEEKQGTNLPQTRPKSKTQLEKPSKETKGKFTAKKTSEKEDLSGKGVPRAQEGEDRNQNIEEEGFTSQKTLLNEQIRRPSTNRDKMQAGKSTGLPPDSKETRPRASTSPQESGKRADKAPQTAATDQKENLESKKWAPVSSIKEAAEEYVPKDSSEDERIYEDITPVSKPQSSYSQPRRPSQESEGDQKTFSGASRPQQLSESPIALQIKEEWAREPITNRPGQRVETPEDRIVEDDNIEFTDELQSPAPVRYQEEQHRRSSHVQGPSENSAGLDESPQKESIHLKRKFVNKLLSLIRPQKAVVVSRQGSLAFVQRASEHQPPIIHEPIVEEGSTLNKPEEVEEAQQLETIAEGLPSGPSEKLHDEAPIHLKKKFLDRLISKVRPQKAVVFARRGNLAFVEKAPEKSESQEERIPQQLQNKPVATTLEEQPHDEIEHPAQEVPIHLKRKFIEKLLGKIRPQNAIVQSRRGIVAAVTGNLAPAQKEQAKVDAGSRTSTLSEEKTISVPNLGKEVSDINERTKPTETEETEVLREGLQSLSSPSKPVIESNFVTTIFGSQRPSLEPQKVREGGFLSKLGLDPETTQSIVRAIFSNMRPEITRIRYRRSQYAPIVVESGDEKIESKPETIENKPTDQQRKSIVTQVSEPIEVTRAKLKQAVSNITPETARFRFKTPHFADIQRLSKPTAPRDIYEEEKEIIYKAPQSPEKRNKSKASYSHPEETRLPEALHMSPDEISLIRKIEDDAAKKIQDFFKNKTQPKTGTKQMRSGKGFIKTLKESQVQTDHNQRFPPLDTPNDLSLRYQDFVNRLTKMPVYILAIHLTNIYLFAREEISKRSQ